MVLNQTTPKSATPSADWPPLWPATAHLWWLKLSPLDEGGSDDILSPDERLRAQRLRRPGAASRFRLGRAGLRRILAGYLGMPPQALRLAYQRNGKPYLPDAPRISFSLSHAGDAGLLAVADGRRVGADVELLGQPRRWLAIARRCLPKSELQRLWALPEDERPRAVQRCWTRQEAFLKASGQAALRRLLRLEMPCAAGSGRFTIRDAQGCRWLTQDVSQSSAVGALVVERQRGERIEVLSFAWPGRDRL
ncbi:MAG: hypothetical protein CFK52_08235 [Chloracidobacterium sp. CP2_5A]|nr:MAG: hypothetical protein CFK52_08235 [Chloracidobacterium sp. CP2_5A]